MQAATPGLGAADVRHMEYWADYLFRNYMVTGTGSAGLPNAPGRCLPITGILGLGLYKPGIRNASDSRTVRNCHRGRPPWCTQVPGCCADRGPESADIWDFLPANKDGLPMRYRTAMWNGGISTATARDKEKMEAAERFLKFVIIQKDSMKISGRHGWGR
ncbi:MAG: hypothetical protein ACLR0F_26715 [Eisenbergiella sp.]